MWRSFKFYATKVLTIGPGAVIFWDNIVYIAKVEGDSMQPLLNPDESVASDIVLLNRWAGKRFKFARGDVVALISPRDPRHTLIKRIIALEGDTVKRRSEGGTPNTPAITVIPAGHCWVEGDHSSRSLDSNFFGPVPLGLICATATRVIWPLNRWQKLDKRDYDRSRVLPYMSSIIEEEDS